MSLSSSDIKNIKDLVKLTLDEDETLVRKDDIKNLPTKDEFFSKMDEVMGELSKIREGDELLTNKVYSDHEERLKKVEKKVGIQTL